MMISTDLFNHIFERNVNKMKKVINGKMYNTDTAKRMADWSYGYPGNFEYYEEELYKKKTGEFSFMEREGREASTAIAMGQKHTALARLSRILRNRLGSGSKNIAVATRTKRFSVRSRNNLST